MRGNGAWVDVRATCPYCDYATTITARDIRGQRFVLECLDCRETFVVEVACQVTHRTRALADVDKDAVLERLTRQKNGTTSPPSRTAVGASTVAAGDNRSRTAAAGDKPPRPPLKARRMQGTRY